MSENPLYDRLCAFEGREDGPGRVAEDPVGMAVIRRWVEAFGDENPIDRDEMAAHDAGRTGIVRRRPCSRSSRHAAIARPWHRLRGWRRRCSSC